MTFKAMKFRVESPEHSEKIQKVLFDMGYSWYKDNGDSGVLFKDAKYIYCYTSGDIKYGFGLKEFLWFKIPEYTLKEIISYELVPVPIQKPEELIELNGLKYKKSELEEALKLIKPIED